MEEKIERKTTYFRYCGETNTENLLKAVKKRCSDSEAGKVVIASETGRSVLKALGTFKGTGIKIIAVTHYPAFTPGPKGRIPIGIKRKEYAKTLKKLEENGIAIVQGTVPFAPPSRSANWNYPTPEAMVDKTLELFGAGAKVAIEAAIMATDAGEVQDGEEIICCAGTYKGLDTALVVKATQSANFFRDFEVREIVAKPVCRTKPTSDGKFENWKGSVDEYYQMRKGH